MPGLEGEQIGHDFGSGLQTEQGAQLEEQIGRLMRIGGLAQLAEFYRAAPPAVPDKEFVRFAKNGQIGKEQFGWWRFWFRAATCAI